MAWSTEPAAASVDAKRCAVIGHPIAHSLSPLLHSAAYRQLGLADRFRYDAFDVAPSELEDFVSSRGPEWVGLSVTAPHKEALLAFGEPTSVAAELRAGNTLIFGHDGQPNRVYNTDVTGFIAALASVAITSAGTAIIVGAGATARSCLAALTEMGVRNVTTLARDERRAMDSLSPIAARTGVELRWAPLSEGPVPSPGVDLVVNTAPANLEPQLAAALVDQAQAVFEAVYNFYPSNLDLAAQAAGKIALDGMHLLVFQAIDQLELMTGRRVAPAPLLEIGHRALGGSYS